MSSSKGFASLGAFKKFASATAGRWGTATACATGHQVRLLSESISGGPAYLADESIAGSAFRDAGDTGEERWEGTIETYLRYNGLDMLLACAFGATGGTPSAASTGSAAHQQYLRPADSLETIFGTLCIDRTGSNDIREYDSVKINGFTITANAGERVTCSFDILARDMSNDSAINTSSSGWTDPDTVANREYVIFEDATVYLEANAGALATLDTVFPSGFSITLANNLAGDITTSNAPNIDEPLRDGFADVTGSITFPVWGTTSGTDATSGEKWEDAYLAKTTYALAIEFTGSVIDGANSNEFNIYLPSIEFTSSDSNIGGAGKADHTLNFVATRPMADVDLSAFARNTTFSNASQYALWIELQNRETSDVGA